MLVVVTINSATQLLACKIKCINFIELSLFSLTMAASSEDSAGWKNLKPAMADLQDLLRCWTCNKVFTEPVSYRCGHFFCGHCAKEAGSKCGSCNVPSLPSEIVPDRIVTAVLGCFQTLSAVINGEREAVCQLAVRAPNMENSSSKSVHSVDNSAVGINKSPLNGSKPDPPKGKEDSTITKASPAKSEIEKPFVKPSRGRKPSLKGAKKPVALKKSEISNEKKSLDCLEKNNPGKKTKLGLDRSLSIDAAVSTASERSKKTGAQDEQFSPDCFATPKKPRKSNNKLSDVSSISKTKEMNSTVKSTPRKSNTPGRELAKKNHKGETPLHVACIKGNIARVRSLLEANATPNTKDNAGWTPLHEAANHGFTEVVELLVKAGAFLDVPGAGNLTPLHEAVANNHIEIVKLLVAHGADIYARSSDGNTPLDLAISKELKNALLNSSKVEASPKTDSNTLKSALVQEEAVLYGDHGLTSDEKKQLQTIAATLNVKLVPAFGPDVTHFVAASDDEGSCPPSLDLLSALLKGTFLLNRDWLELGERNLQDDRFELAGITDFIDAEAPKLSRTNSLKQLPRLFNGCHFYVTNNAHFNLTNCNLTRADIIALIKAGAGIVLTRQPDPEAIPASEKTVPYHAPRNGALVSTSHFILYSPGKGEPEMKYNMKHCKTLPVEWFINCVLNWQLLDP
ncbi:BRCA1-associated RING domain protein 1-like isoform X2 [Thrips palmi]|uniref:BRCA1-associated RING domain protein 1-like isoform X2 n=1 Tax=Thrips palmi TaxID=161013 RepID=A0A6P8ZAL3_THRPL|nr:BRCA1-associated RING domain protein 1-like isoform X2 [Thrips palmi]